MLHHQRLELPEGIRLEPSEDSDILLGHFEGGRLKRHSPGPRGKDKGQVDVKDGPVFSDHDVAVVPVLQVKHVLNQAKP